MLSVCLCLSVSHVNLMCISLNMCLLSIDTQVYIDTHINHKHLQWCRHANSLCSSYIAPQNLCCAPLRWALTFRVSESQILQNLGNIYYVKSAAHFTQTAPRTWHGSSIWRTERRCHRTVRTLADQSSYLHRRRLERGEWQNLFTIWMELPIHRAAEPNNDK